MAWSDAARAAAAAARKAATQAKHRVWQETSYGWHKQRKMAADRAVRDAPMIGSKVVVRRPGELGRRGQVGTVIATEPRGTGMRQVRVRWPSGKTDGYYAGNLRVARGIAAKSKKRGA